MKLVFVAGVQAEQNFAYASRLGQPTKHESESARSTHLYEALGDRSYAMLANLPAAVKRDLRLVSAAGCCGIQLTPSLPQARTCIIATTKELAIATQPIAGWSLLTSERQDTIIKEYTENVRQTFQVRVGVVFISRTRFLFAGAQRLALCAA